MAAALQRHTNNKLVVAIVVVTRRVRVAKFKLALVFGTILYMMQGKH